MNKKETAQQVEQDCIDYIIKQEKLTYNPWYFKVLNGQLIKKPKPCLPGMQVHVKPFNGCFNVIDVKIDYFVIMKNRKQVKIDWEDFLCLKGQGQSAEAMLKRDIKTVLAIVERSSIANANVIEEMTWRLKELKKDY